MKSGQILSHIYSKTDLNIIWLPSTSVVYGASPSTMATSFGSLAEVTWTEAERRCAGVMILTRKVTF